MNILYVFSLGHSGSTMLDFILSHHPKVLGCGEILDFHRHKQHTEGTNTICSCGKTYTTCDFWGDISPEEHTLETFYSSTKQKAATLGYAAILDSSKRRSPIAIWQRLQESSDHLRVLFLTRDPRGWTQSMLGLKHQARRRLPTWLYVIKWMWYWKKKHHEMLNFLQSNNIPYRLVSYQEACFETETLARSILAEAGLDPDAWDLSEEPQTHIAHGNRMKMQNRSRDKVQYDARWFENPTINLMYFLVPGVSKLNRKLKERTTN